MKLIVAIIKPHKLDDVRNGLTSIGQNGITVSNVEGGSQVEELGQALTGLGALLRLRSDLAAAQASAAPYKLI